MKLHSFVAVLILSILLVALPAPGADPQVFASFENPAEIGSIRVSEGVRIRQSAKFPAWEANSLEVNLPSGGGWLEMASVPVDWTRQEAVLAFVWSLQPGDARLELTDAGGRRAEKTFRLRAGVNHLQWKLSEAQGLERRSMRALKLSSASGGTWYVDYFMLDRFHPVLVQRGRWDIDYSMEVETPHVPWARPLTGGPIKVFAIADVADGRGVIELAQRLELGLRATTIGSSPGTNKWGFGDFYVQRSSGGEFWKHAYSLAHTYIADDLIHGPRYDVILWPGVRPWDSYPEEVRGALRRRVEEGTGLVLFYPFNRDGKPADTWTPSPLVRVPDVKSEDSNNFYRNRFEDLDHSAWQRAAEHYITRGVALDLFPWRQMAVPACRAEGTVLLRTSAGNPVLVVHTVGKGRVAAFAYAEKGMIPEIHSVFETGLNYPYHEYLWSLVARATIWAARREPEPAIQGVTAASTGVEARASAVPPGSRLAVTVRNSSGEVENEGVAAEGQNPGLLRYSLPRLQGGLHIAELRLLQGEKVLDWSAVAFDVPASAVIAAVTPSSDRVRVGEEVRVRIRLSEPGRSDCELRVRLLDNYGRVLDEKRSAAPASGNLESVYGLKSQGALTHLARIDCELFVDGIRADSKFAEVFILQPRKWDDYDVVMYRFGPDPIPGIWPKIDEQLRRLHVTTLSSYSVTHSKHANYNVQAQTRISGQESPDGPARNYYTEMKKKYLATGDKSVLVREYVLDDPAYRERITAELNRLTQPWVPFSPMSYYVYEEPSLTCYGDAVDICFSPFTLQGMRRWLREIYGSLEDLNRQWGTAFGAWEAVVPDDSKEAQARGNYASWADHRTYMEKTYADTFRFVLAQLRKIDPEGILLNSGTQISGSHNGCDYSRINLYTRHLNAYDGGNQLDFHRNFGEDLKISGGSGYGVLGKNVLYDLYDGLFKGSNGGAYIFWQYSTIDPDLTMSQSGRDMTEGLREMRGEGIGKLVGLATPDNHGIAIHYSYPSIHGAWIVDGAIKGEVSYHTSRTFDRFNENRDGWVRVLKDSGLQFDFIAYSAIEAGGLKSKGYKTLVLPMSVALSDREIEAIREFVAGGGTLIADALPGIMDQHCTFRRERPLQEVFGVSAMPGTREALIEGSGDPGLRPAGAATLIRGTDKPLLLSHSFGRGRAYLLNKFLSDYPAAREQGKGGPMMEQVARVLNDAHLNPRVSLTDANGQRVPECATYLFNLGTTRLLGLIPDKRLAGEKRIRIRFDGSGAIYDVRRKRLEARGEQIETTIEAAVPRLFALVGEAVGGIDIETPAAAKRGEEITVRFSVRGGRAFRSVAKIEILDPAGRAVGYYGRNEDIVDGVGSFRFRTALNESAGNWSIVVTDVLSGRRATADLKLMD